MPAKDRNKESGSRVRACTHAQTTPKNRVRASTHPTDFTMTTPTTDNYLTHTRGIASWIFTLDHKRIGVMYLVSVLVAFFLGGIVAMLIRTQLLRPEGVLFHGADLSVFRGYNELFTLHGALMIFLVLIPGTPGALGNFVLPIMLGAKDVAFPRVNLWGYYFYVIGAVLALASIVFGASIPAGRSIRLTARRPRRGDLPGFRGVRARLQLDLHRHQLHRHHPQAPPDGHDLVPHAAVPLGPLRHGHHPDRRHARAGNYALAADPRTAVPPGHLQSRTTAAIRSSSSISSGSTRIRPSTL